MKNLATRLLVLLLCACQAAPGPKGPIVHADALPTAPAELGRLYVYRLDSPVFAGDEFRVWVNGAEIGAITSGTYVYIDVKPGTYNVSVAVRHPGGPATAPLPEAANVRVSGKGDYYVRISHVGTGAVIAATMIMAALAGADAAAGVPAGANYVPVIPGSPSQGHPLHPEQVPEAEATKELASLAYAKPAENALSGEPAHLGLSYVMTDGAGEKHPVVGGKVLLVLPDTAAAKAGILPGDVLVLIGTTPVTDANTVRQVMKTAVTGSTLPLVFYRDGQRLEAAAAL